MCSHTMKESTLILLLSWIIAQSQGQVLFKVMNGYLARMGQFPYHAYISDDRSGPCGASIIHKRWLLTAAHCRLDTRYSYASVGTIYRSGSNGIRYNFRKFIQHDEYDEYDDINIFHDIALIRLDEDIKFGKYVQPIKLDRDQSNDYANVSATLSGWGLTDPRQRWGPVGLQYASLKVMGERECSKVYEIEDQICTYGSYDQPSEASACEGDSGGPLVYKNRQIGVVSYGRGRCGTSSPTVYAKVSSYVPWIEKQLKRYCDELPQ